MGKFNNVVYFVSPRYPCMSYFITAMVSEFWCAFSTFFRIYCISNGAKAELLWESSEAKIWSGNLMDLLSICATISSYKMFRENSKCFENWGTARYSSVFEDISVHRWRGSSIGEGQENTCSKKVLRSANPKSLFSSSCPCCRMCQLGARFPLPALRFFTFPQVSSKMFPSSGE